LPFLYTSYTQIPYYVRHITSLIATIIKYNLERHYDAKHAIKFDAIQGQLRNDKITELKKKLYGQQLTFQRQNVESESSVKVNYI
jgi:hypothetical protein